MNKLKIIKLSSCVSKKKAAEEAKRKNLLALLKERQNKRKLSPLCPTPNKKTKADNLSNKVDDGEDKVDDDDDDDGDDDDDDDDDGGVVPEKLFQEARQKQLLYKKQVNKMSLQLQETKQKLEEHMKRSAEVEAENKQLRSLNMQLQQQLLKSLNSSSDSRPPKPKGTINVQNPQQQKPKSTLQIAEADCEQQSLSRQEDEIQLVKLGDIQIRSDTWTAIQKNTRDSLFVKELAVAFWGTKTLGDRSLTGKECPTTKTTKRPLTPQKLHTLKACFKEWLVKGNVVEPELQHHHPMLVTSIPAPASHAGDQYPSMACWCCDAGVMLVTSMGCWCWDAGVLLVTSMGC
ncbi:putative uncharacterized protein DDB_G0270496 [Danio aesculapii]|uniref:putative uncharacterized protein DDB_G0270496 n=1 Tax=Danio aesculapii TaxID=1142201 RepID=UPI0024BFCED6|nr:putative uncharacterized protein DDB_G0270496 [Danio aesculapii]